MSRRAFLFALVAFVLIATAALALLIFDEDLGEERAFGFVDNSNRQGVPPDLAADLASSAGADAARFGVSWTVVQCCEPSGFDWSAYDPVVTAMKTRGLDPLPTFSGTPAWARPEGCTSSLCPPAEEHLDEFAAFAAAAVSRWHDPEGGSPLLGAQIWNEPNSAGAWPVDGGPDPSAYAKLFSETAAAIDDVDDDLPILIAGLNGRSAVSDPPLYSSIPDYLGAVLEEIDPAVLDDQDLIAAHPYAARFSSIMAETREARDRFEPGRRIMVTETGSTSEFPTPDEQRQADQIEAILRELESADDVAGVFVYTLIDAPPSEGGEHGLGVVGEPSLDYAPKVAYCEIARLEGRSPPTCPGVES